MKKRIIALSMALALMAVLAAPLAALADTGVTDINATLGSTFTLIAPSDASFSTFVVGTTNTGTSTAGSVEATGTAGWTLTVTDEKSLTTGYMTIGGADDVSKRLTNPIQVGMTAGTVGTIGAYQTALTEATGYGTNTTFSIPLFLKQTIVGGDAAGSYKITLTYTATPS
jgi:hypothetical protein